MLSCLRGILVQMCFRGLLSTSNVIASDTITVSTDEDLLWITAVQDTAALHARDSFPAAR
jgi:hypothetical protein